MRKTTVARTAPPVPRFQLPELYCPFGSAVNRDAMTADAQTTLWVREQALLGGEQDYERFARVRLGWLAARTTPNASPQALQLVTDWCSWLFIRDDTCDEQGLGRDPAALQRLHARFREILEGAGPQGSDLPLSRALADLWRRTRQAATSEWQRRFVNHLEAFFEAGVWEARNRAAGHIPSVAEYVNMRPYTGGIFAYLDLIELSEPLDLPGTARAHATVQRLQQIANGVVCWSNDILSLAKEIRRGDIHNLVISMRESHGLSWQAAVERAAALHDSEVRAFQRLELDLPTFGARESARLQRYVSGLRHFMRGSLDWLMTSHRYLLHGALP